MAHVVTGAAVQVTAAGRTHFLETGAIIPDGVPEEVLDRLVLEGLIGEFEVIEYEPVPVTVFSQADVDAAVQAAADANEAELKQARQIIEAEAAVVAQQKAELEQAQADFATKTSGSEKTGSSRQSPKPGQQ